MTREQRTAEVIAKTFDTKITELENTIAFRQHSAESDKKWIEKMATPETIDLLINDLVQHETEVKIFEAMLKEVKFLRAEEMMKAIEGSATI